MTHMKKKLQVILLIVLSAILLCLLFIIFLNKRIVKVTFDTDGGTPIEAIVLKKGSVLKLQKETTREGFVFDAWYLDGEPYDFSQKVERSFTLYATWKKKYDEKKEESSDMQEGSIEEKAENPIPSDGDSVGKPSSSTSQSSTPPSSESSESSDSSSDVNTWGHLGGLVDLGNLGNLGFANVSNCGPNGTYNPETELCERTLTEDAVIYACTSPAELKAGKCYTESRGNIRCNTGTYTMSFGHGCWVSPGFTPDYEMVCPPTPMGYARVVFAKDPRKCYKIVDKNKEQCEASGYEYRRLILVVGGAVTYKMSCVNMNASIPIVPCKKPIEGEILVGDQGMCRYAKFYSPPPGMYCINGTVNFGTSCYQQLTGGTWEKYKCAKPDYTLSGNKCTKKVTYKPYF